MKQNLMNWFEEVFGDHNHVQTYFAPGRVNLIGEHTDYNGGHVFPCALTIGTYAACRFNNTNKLRFYSENFKELGIIEVELDHLVYDKKDDWTNYPKGIIWAINEKEVKVNKGMDILYYGNIPNGSGLSSSASIEVLTAFMMTDLFGLDMSFVDMALLGQYSENNFNKVNCGIMDQFAIAMGKKDHAIFLDTATLSFDYAPLHLKGSKIVIANTNKKRGLGESKYNERRSECETALKRLQTVVDITSLGDLTEEKFNEFKYVINDAILEKRAKHAVFENERTLKAVEALKADDLSLFGKLMIDSHNSLRDDYEVTGIELDTLVEEILKQDGVIGSRMTGAGFGGCTVSIVKEEAIEALIQAVTATYTEKIGYAPDFYVVEPGNGPCKLD